MLRQMVDRAARKRAEAEATQLVAKKLKDSKDYQKRLEQQKRWIVKLLGEARDTAAGAGFYGVSIILALIIGATVAINIPYAVVCREIDLVCPMRIKGQTLNLDDIR